MSLQKFWEISRQIHEFMTWTQVECPFEKDKKIQSYLLTAPIYSEEGRCPNSTQPQASVATRATDQEGSRAGWMQAGDRGQERLPAGR